jgi:hypothetical protein
MGRRRDFDRWPGRRNGGWAGRLPGMLGGPCRPVPYLAAHVSGEPCPTTRDETVRVRTVLEEMEWRGFTTGQQNQ